MFFKLSYLNSNLALTLGYLNPALNNSALVISSANWDKSARADVSKTYQISWARRASAICGLWKIYKCWFIQIAREKPCDYLLIIYMQKLESLFLVYMSALVTAPCSRRQMTTSITIGQNVDRWMLMDKNAAARNLLTENWSMFSLPPRRKNRTAIKIPLFVVFCLFGFWLRKASQGLATGVSSMAVFVVHVGFYSRAREKTKAFLTSLTSFQELHLRSVWVTVFFVSVFHGILPC